MIKLPPFINEIIITITNFIGVEPSRIVRSIIISILIVSIIVAVVVMFSLLRSLFRRNKQSDNTNTEAQTKAQGIDAAIAPSGAEYERIIHDAIEKALLPINRRIKRLEERASSATDDGIQPAETEPPPQADATKLYDDVQDVVLPQSEDAASETQDTGQHAVIAEDSAEHTTIAPIEATGLQAVPEENTAEHTTVAPMQDIQPQEASPSSEDTGLQAVPPSAEDNTQGTALNAIPSEAEDSNPKQKAG